MVHVRVSPRGRNSFTKTQEAIIKALRNDSVYTKLDDERKSNTAKEYLVGFEVKINGYNGELFCNYETVKDEHDDIDVYRSISFHNSSLICHPLWASYQINLKFSQFLL